MNYLEVKDICRYRDVTVGEMVFHVNGEHASLMCMWRSNRGISVRHSMGMPRGRMTVKYQRKNLWLPALVLSPTPTHRIVVEPLVDIGWNDFGTDIYVFRKGDELFDNDARFQQLVRLLRDSGVSSAFIGEDSRASATYYYLREEPKLPSLRELTGES